MNDVIKLLNAHRSIRKFTDQAIPQGLLRELIKAGQAAATSSHVQAYTVIHVKDAAQLSVNALDEKYINKHYHKRKSRYFR